MVNRHLYDIYLYNNIDILTYLSIYKTLFLNFKKGNIGKWVRGDRIGQRGRETVHVWMLVKQNTTSHRALEFLSLSVLPFFFSLS